MSNTNMIREIYYGNIHPCDRGFRDGTVFAAALEAFAIQEKWLREHLTEESLRRLDELISCHKTLSETLAFENFQVGYQLGAQTIMDVVADHETDLYGLWSS